MSERQEQQPVLRLYREQPLKGIRKMISSRLGTIWREAVHVTIQKKLDITDLYSRKSELTFSLIDYIYYSLVLTLQKEEFSAFNAHFDGQVLSSFSSVNLGLATDHPKGLIVPVIHRADLMNIDRFVARRKELTAKAKAWRQSFEELENGTFTVTNLGTLGIDWFTPILNPPQTAILGIGRIAHEAVSWDRDHNLTVKATLPLSLTMDHRVLDGAEAARFLLAFEECLHELAYASLSQGGEPCEQPT